MDPVASFYLWLCSFGWEAVLLVHLVPCIVIAGLFFALTEGSRLPRPSTAVAVPELPYVPPTPRFDSPIEFTIRVEHHHYHHEHQPVPHRVPAYAEVVKPSSDQPPMIVPGQIVPPARKELPG